MLGLVPVWYGFGSAKFPEFRPNAAFLGRLAPEVIETLTCEVTYSIHTLEGVS